MGITTYCSIGLVLLRFVGHIRTMGLLSFVPMIKLKQNRVDMFRALRWGAGLESSGSLSCHLHPFWGLKHSPVFSFPTQFYSLSTTLSVPKCLPATLQGTYKEPYRLSVPTRAGFPIGTSPLLATQWLSPRL